MTQIHFEREPGQNSAMQDLTPPKPFVSVALLIVAATIWFAISATRFGHGSFDEPDGPMVGSRSLVFSDASNGGIDVYDAIAHAVVYQVPPNSNQFLRGAIRGLARSRRAAHVAPSDPFILAQWENGRMTLDDPSTGERVSISSFGPTQVESFQALLLAGR